MEARRGKWVESLSGKASSRGSGTNVSGKTGERGIRYVIAYVCTVPVPRRAK